MKSKFLYLSLAAIAGTLMPLAAAGQVAPEAGSGPVRRSAPAHNYEAFAAFSYTSINQVNQSERGLIGSEFGFARNFGRYFGLSAQGNYYSVAAGKGYGGVPNPGNPVVYSVFAGPQLNVPITDRLSGLFYALLGYEHTGGEAMNPDASFSGGFGGGMTYFLKPHWGIRLTGQRVGGAFSVRDNSPSLGLSPHITWNSSVAIGPVYRF